MYKQETDLFIFFNSNKAGAWIILFFLLKRLYIKENVSIPCLQAYVIQLCLKGNPFL